MKLYEIDSSIQSLIDAIADADGEITPEQEQEWERLLGAKDNKLANIARLLRQKTIEMEMLQGEIERLDKRYDANVKTVEWLKGYVTNSLGEGNNWSDGLFSFGWRSSEVIEVEAALAEIPEQFVRIIPEDVKADKLRMKEYLKRENLVEGPGFRLVKKRHLKLS